MWGNAATVLVGDFLYSRAFQMMVAVDIKRVMNIMASTTNEIAQGEVMQLLNTHNPKVTEQNYLTTITRKTARLFESAARLGAILAEAGPATESNLADFGLYLGIAFQVIDDALDYTSDAIRMGKNSGDDLAEGKTTLPLIYAIQNSSKKERKILEAAIVSGERESLNNIQQIIESTGALEYTLDKAREYSSLAKRAIDSIPESNYRSALLELADFSVSRTF